MAKDEPLELTTEEALIKANEALESGPLASMGIHIQTPEEMRLRFAEQLLTATTVDDLLAESPNTGWGQHEGRSVLVRNVSYAPSTKKGPLGFYAIVNAVDVETNEPLLLTSGSENVVMQLARLVQIGGTDVPVKLSAGTTADGNTVHRLVKGDTGTNAPF